MTLTDPFTDPFAAPANPKTSNKDVDDFLGGGGGSVAAKFPEIGHSYTGIVTAKRLEHQRDYQEPEKKLYWRNKAKKALSLNEVTPDDKPVMQAVVTLMTDAQGSFDRNGKPIEVEDDNGERLLYVKGMLQKVVREAVRSAGAPTVELFSKVTITYVADGEQPNPKYEPPKIYTVTYVPASKVAKNDPLLVKALTNDAEDAFLSA